MSRSTTTTARHWCLAVVAVLATGPLSVGSALAHDEGLTPYHYVDAPPGVSSQGPAQSGSSTQPLGRFGFAGTTDNQMQLTLPEGALLPLRGQTGVRVQLDQLAPASLPPLPAGLEPEGNGYRVRLSYTPSGTALEQLDAPATLGLSAPAPPTALYQLVGGTWRPADFLPVTTGAGSTSVVELDGPGTFLQAYDPDGPRASASPAAPAAAGPARAAPPLSATPRTEPRGHPRRLAVSIGAAALLLASGLVARQARRRRRTGPRRSGQAPGPSAPRR